MKNKRDINHLAVRLSIAERLKAGLNPRAKTSVKKSPTAQPATTIPKNGDFVRGKRTGWNTPVTEDTEDEVGLNYYPNNDIQGILFVNPVPKSILADAYTQYLVSKVGVDPATIQILKTAEDLEKMVR